MSCINKQLSINRLLLPVDVINIIKDYSFHNYKIIHKQRMTEIRDSLENCICSRTRAFLEFPNNYIELLYEYETKGIKGYSEELDWRNKLYEKIRFEITADKKVYNNKYKYAGYGITLGNQIILDWHPDDTPLNVKIKKKLNSKYLNSLAVDIEMTTCISCGNYTHSKTWENIIFPQMNEESDYWDELWNKDDYESDILINSEIARRMPKYIRCSCHDEDYEDE